jgi:hypothetical protein
MIDVAIFLLVAWVLRLGWCLSQAAKLMQVQAIQNEHLESVNAWLRSRCATPDIDVSDCTDGEAAVSLAIRSGYIHAIVSQGVKEDARRRPAALREALEYYREHVAAAVASANH